MTITMATAPGGERRGEPGRAPGPATDLGFLLHKHPGRAQSFELAVGTAHVFFPEASPVRCTAALLLEVDPVALVRGKSQVGGGDGFSLGQYVNDRPYAASSMLAVALGRVFRTAMTGRCEARPELAAAAIPLEIGVPVLPCRGGADLAARLLEPLGWQVRATPIPLDESFGAWGDSRYVDLRAVGVVRLADALNHLYVLLPVLDDSKHYWVSPDEVDKLVRAGSGWLAGHPEKDLISRRYLAHKAGLLRSALARLAEVDDAQAEDFDNAVPQAQAELAAGLGPGGEPAEPGPEAGQAGEGAADRPVPLARQRRAAVLGVLRAAGARRVADLGCGEGAFTAELLADPSFTEVVAADVSSRALQIAERRLRVEQMSPRQRDRLRLIQSSLTYRDQRLAGLDAVVLIEVIEHVDPPRLPALERTVFTGAAPGLVVVTTPNREYNARFEFLAPGAMRHYDHRFEWTRAEFAAWASRVASERGYQVRFLPVGDSDAEVGPPTQLAVFTRREREEEYVLDVPEQCLVVLIGASGSGKSTFAREHFAPTEVVSSDFCRGLVADDENDQSASADAFDVLHFIAGKRLAAGRLTVVDATNVQPDSRKHLIALAREHDVLPAAIVLDVPEQVCLARNATRADRQFGPHVIRRQRDQLRRGLRGLAKEGFRKVHVLTSEEQVAAASVVRTKLYCDLRDQAGPFDVIGDVHGCLAELEALLADLGYELRRDEAGRPVGARHAAGRRVVFVGDLVDRGPDSPGVVRLVIGMTGDGDALCVAGNHEAKLLRALRGRDVKVSHGLAETLAQLEREPEEFRAQVESFIDGLISHYVLDGGKLVVSHAGLTERLQGRASARVRSFCLYGDTTGETDEFGLPVRYPWASDYRGRAMVLYGHTPVLEPEWVNGTMCLDTGCVFGGMLSALRYPERELVSVAAARVYYESARPLAAPRQPQRDPDVLDLTDVTGRRVVQTAHHGRITIREENAAAALEVMSRFAIDPRWLVYLPPTMSPVATSAAEGLLEHPAQAFEAFRADGVESVVCEEKHMGSRAALLVCRDAGVASARFGAQGFDAQGFGGQRDSLGAAWTRTGRPFFGQELSSELLSRVRAAAVAAGLFDELETGWVLLDGELLPWSAKAAELIRQQYAAVGAAACHVLPEAVGALEQAAQTGLDVTALLDRTRARAANATAFRAAYRRYCWPTDRLTGVSFAPFQVLASDGATYADRPHTWHLDVADRLAAADPGLIASTGRVHVDVADPASVAAATQWWEALTLAGGEGMVVKPAGNLTRGRRGLVQPGLKVRGREYLRIIYGPDYTEPANLARLRERGLSHKRSLAAREYALGLEGLDRFARGEPLWRVHECVFAVLALESEPVDPRL